MQVLLLGLAALVIGLIAMRRFTQANTAVMAKQVRVVGGWMTLAVALAFAARGAIAQAVFLALAATWLLGWRGSGGWGGFPGSGRKSPGQASRIATDHLEVELDHDTGALSGRVIRGIFEGRTFEALRPAELALLWQDCRFTDPQSAQIIEVYLDRMHVSWREDMARGEREMADGPDGRMTADEAFEILGLKAGASDEDIRRAHRDLMLKLHPDRGGSTYLAAKINEAKDVLLAR